MSKEIFSLILVVLAVGLAAAIGLLIFLACRLRGQKNGQAEMASVVANKRGTNAETSADAIDAVNAVGSVDAMGSAASADAMDAVNVVDAIDENEQFRKEFTANVSHELKTPLQSISGYAELLKGGLVRTEDVPKFSGRIYSEAQRMITLIEDLLELSRLDEGVEGMKKESVDMGTMILKVMDSLRVEAENAGVALNFEGDAGGTKDAGGLETGGGAGWGYSDQGGISVFGYAQMIELIIFNLCENGIKYNHAGGQVSVSLKQSDDKVILTVSDDGIGIPKDQQERIFERFYRVDKSRSKEVGGTGLGLSIVKHAAEMHDAEVQLESEAGKGTKITVGFPVGKVFEEDKK